MKKKTFLIITTFLFLNLSYSQKINFNDHDWSKHNRVITIAENVCHLNGQPGNGLYYCDFDFSNGTIELDIKGKDIQGRSFVGFAFHIKDENTYDAVYFRPFNFHSPERKNHGVQYISHPEFPWYVLRKNYPEKYENEINPKPDPNQWFHVKIVIDYPMITVYVNDSESSSLKVEKIGKQKTGKIGFWVGNNSEGWFKNLKITEK